MLTPQYVKGFNHGYILAKYEPSLAKQVIKPQNNHSDYLKGLISGKQEFKMEKTLGKKRTQPKPTHQTKKVNKGRNK